MDSRLSLDDRVPLTRFVSFPFRRWLIFGSVGDRPRDARLFELAGLTWFDGYFLTWARPILKE